VKTDYPNGDDLAALLTSAGFDSATVTAMDTDTAIEAAIEGWERAIGRTMLASPVDSTHWYSPPTIGNVLPIDDVVSITSVVYQPFGGTAQTLVAGTDYHTEPANASARRAPITALRLRRSWQAPIDHSLQLSIGVTGRHGAGSTLPADVWQAMLCEGALLLWPQLTQRATSGLLGWKEGDVAEDYGVETWKRLKDAWSDTSAQAQRRYMRVVL